MSSPSPRSTAARIVGDWLTSGSYPSLALAQVQRHHAFVLEVVQGTMRWLRALEFMRDSLLERRPRPGVDALLLTALYQLFYLDPGDEHAVVNETVDAAKREGGAGAGRLCNGVLRNALRRREALRAALAAQPFAVRCSHPDLLVARWSARFGSDATRDLCEWNNLRPEVTLRIRRDRTDPETFVLALCDAGIDVRPHPYAPEECLVLPRGIRIRDLPGYGQGWFAVQDPATIAAPRLLEVLPGHRVLDLCAAPGGKTALLAEAAGEQGVVVAGDISADRLQRLHENVDRLGLANVRTVHAPTGLAGEENFDRILLDVPCSNTGVLRRRPDARWRFDPSALAGLEALQRSLLDQAAACLRAGGCMVYSTCSLEPEENGERVRGWLADHPGWMQDAEIALHPFATGTDGAYAARLLRRG